MKKVLKTFLTKISLKYIPSKFKNSILSYKVFHLNREIKYDESGFYFIYPKIKKETLNFYYENYYWSLYNSTGLNNLIGKRDLNQFIFLKKILKEKLYDFETFINFGSGHGGVSFLFKLIDFSVTNIEPGINKNIINYFETGWEYINEIEKLKKSKSIFYSSHSLEHVHDVNLFFGNLNSKLNKGSILFFEVPNCEYIEDNNGGVDYTIRDPHTFYFTTKFFEKLKDFKLIKIESTSVRNSPLNNNGGVIRVLLEKIN